MRVSYNVRRYANVFVMSLPTDQRKKYIVGSVSLLAAFAILAVFHFTTEEKCFANVVTSASSERVEFTTAKVPCDCLAGQTGFLTRVPLVSKAGPVLEM